jgi:hypothetical protein
VALDVRETISGKFFDGGVQSVRQNLPVPSELINGFQRNFLGTLRPQEETK